MRRLGLVAVLGLLLSALSGALSGCGRTPPPKPPVGPGKNGTDDVLKTATDLLRQAKDLAPVRDGLNLVNDYLNRAEKRPVRPLDDATRSFLTDHFGLDKDELADVEATTFRAADAHYVEGCLLFRDAARWLEIASLAPRDQALHSFRWAMRRVLLHEQADEGVPPAFVLRRGHGSVRERALVVIEILRQAQIDSCLLICGDGAAAPLLVVAVVNPADNEVLLLDPRLGRPVPGPRGKGFAALADIRSDPALLVAAGVVVQPTDRFHLRLVNQLSSLAPRMQFLETTLNNYDKIALHRNPRELAERLSKATEIQPRPWAVKDPAFPGRALQLFLPPEEGGVDKNQRLARFRSQLVPWPRVLVHYENMRLDSELPAPARLTLQSLTGRILGHYMVQPEEFLLRGQIEDTLKRLFRIRNVLDDLDIALPLEDAVFQKQIAQWRETVLERYAALNNKEENAQARINALWSEDGYLNNLLDPEGEPPQKQQKRILTRLVLTATREPLGQQAGYLVASCWQERGERAQATLEHLSQTAKDTKLAQETARSAWANARTSWNQFVERYGLAPAALQARLDVIRQQNKTHNRLGLLEDLQLDLHIAIAARVHLAKTLAQLGNAKSARAVLSSLKNELDELVKDQAIRKELTDCAARAGGLAEIVHKRVEFLQRDWAPRGPLATWQEVVELRLAKETN